MAGSRFAFNTYHHWQKLVLRGQDELVMSKEGTSYLLYYLLVRNSCKNDYFEHYNFEIKAGHCYLGGYLGGKELAQEYGAEKVTDW
eukprot:15356891-Ditylum_brightwellii.AAC.1